MSAAYRALSCRLWRCLHPGVCLAGLSLAPLGQCWLLLLDCKMLDYTWIVLLISLKRELNGHVYRKGTGTFGDVPVILSRFSYNMQTRNSY